MDWRTQQHKNELAETETQLKALQKHMQKREKVIEAARNFCTALYESGDSILEAFRELPYYEALEQLELALTELDD